MFQMQLVEPLISSENPLVRRACFLSVAVVAEGCADYIIKKYVLFKIIYKLDGLFKSIFLN